MKFLCLAYGSEADWSKLTAAEQEALLAQDRRIRERGAFMSALRQDVTTISAHGGEVLRSGAPFAAARVPLAGFSIIEADSTEEVIDLVAGTPCARAGGAIEIWPLLENHGSA